MSNPSISHPPTNVRAPWGDRSGTQESEATQLTEPADNRGAERGKCRGVIASVDEARVEGGCHAPLGLNAWQLFDHVYLASFMFAMPSAQFDSLLVASTSELLVSHRPPFHTHTCTSACREKEWGLPAARRSWSTSWAHGVLSPAFCSVETVVDSTTCYGRKHSSADALPEQQLLSP